MLFVIPPNLTQNDCWRHKERRTCVPDPRNLVSPFRCKTFCGRPAHKGTLVTKYGKHVEWQKMLQLLGPPVPRKGDKLKGKSALFKNQATIFFALNRMLPSPGLRLPKREKDGPKAVESIKSERLPTGGRAQVGRSPSAHGESLSRFFFGFFGSAPPPPAAAAWSCGFWSETRKESPTISVKWKNIAIAREIKHTIVRSTKKPLQRRLLSKVN